MITKLIIRNFMDFRKEARIDFTPITVFAEDDDSSGTTVLQALSFFQQCIDATKMWNGDGYALEEKAIEPEKFGPVSAGGIAQLWPEGKVAGSISISAQFDSEASVAFKVRLLRDGLRITPVTTGDMTELLKRPMIGHIPDDWRNRSYYGEMKKKDPRRQEITSLGLTIRSIPDRLPILRFLGGLFSRNCKILLVDDICPGLDRHTHMDLFRVLQEIAGRHSLQFILASRSSSFTEAAQVRAITAPQVVTTYLPSLVPTVSRKRIKGK